jgi:hypothetical protein
MCCGAGSGKRAFFFPPSQALTSNPISALLLPQNDTSLIFVLLNLLKPVLLLVLNFVAASAGA